MKNIPRIFLDHKLSEGLTVPVQKDIVHYLTRVMRRRDCLVFNDGAEFSAVLSDDDKNLIISQKTQHSDPSNNITLYFAPIKKLDDMLNMATQLGAKALQPVITDRTVANHVNWERMKKIICEAAEQSNRNSVPELLKPIKFSELDFKGLVFADERAAYGKDFSEKILSDRVLVGPEGGFSDAEFETLDKNGAIGLSLGKTILRAELAGAIAISRLIKYED